MLTENLLELDEKALVVLRNRLVQIAKNLGEDFNNAEIDNRKDILEQYSNALAEKYIVEGYGQITFIYPNAKLEHPNIPDISPIYGFYRHIFGHLMQLVDFNVNFVKKMSDSE